MAIGVLDLEPGEATASAFADATAAGAQDMAAATSTANAAGINFVIMMEATQPYPPPYAALPQRAVRVRIIGRPFAFAVVRR